MIISKHKYIINNNVNKNDTSLILGTIHPHQTDNFQLDYFYGNRNSIWNILAEAFPRFHFDTKENIIHTLNTNNIWISDIILECEREDEKVTQDKLLKNLKLNTEQIKEGIKNSKITTIYFTSGFGKNNAAKLFCDYFGIKETLNSKRKFIISKEIFGREIKGIVLFSPSGQANIGISRNKEYLEQKEKYKQYEKPVNKFKMDFYYDSFKLAFK